MSAIRTRAQFLDGVPQTIRTMAGLELHLGSVVKIQLTIPSRQGGIGAAELVECEVMILLMRKDDLQQVATVLMPPLVAALFGFELLEFDGGEGK